MSWAKRHHGVVNGYIDSSTLPENGTWELDEKSDYFEIKNDSEEESLTFTINEITIEVVPGESWGEWFVRFGEVGISASGNFRAFTKISDNIR